MPVYQPPSEGIKDILIAGGVGVFHNAHPPTAWPTGVWAIGVSRMMATPHRMIVIYDTGGLAPEPGLDIDYPTVQILVRAESNGYKNAYAKCREIKDLLLGRNSETRAGDMWASVTMTSDILHLGYDTPAERPEFSMNFQLIIHQGDLSASHRKDSGP